jgi:hypothetical protein
MRILIATVLAALCNFVSVAQTDPNAKIDLEMVNLAQAPVAVGNEFEVAIMMSAQETQRYLVADIVFGWDPTKVEFLGVSHQGSHPYIWVPPSGLPCVEDENGNAIPDPLCSGIRDFYGINEAMPPADGNGLYFGYGELGQVFLVDSTPVQIVRLQFRVLSQFSSTDVCFIPQITFNSPKSTVIYGSYIPGNNVVGQMIPTTIAGIPEGDISGNGSVGGEDLGMLLSSWGTSSFGPNPADINGDGFVDAADLSVLLANWGT